MKSLRRRFGEKVRALRKAKRLTQEKLGEKSGLHHTYIGSIERAECNLSMDNIAKVAKGLEIEPYELFRFSSGEEAVSEREKSIMELAEALKREDQSTVESILNIVKEALKLVPK